jgi:DNA-binding MarR family transcriptional regulator
VTEVTDEGRVAEALFESIGQFRRRVRRRVGPAWGPSGHTRAEGELLRHVRRNPGTTVSAAAHDLGMAVNTVSTLVSRLVSAGSLVRTTDPRDRRVARLELSEEAAARIGDWRDARVALTAAALEALSAADRRTLEAALPVLDRLTGLIDADAHDGVAPTPDQEES